MSQQIQLEILDHLRPYLRTVYNQGSNIKSPIDLSNESLLRFMLNRCFDTTLNDNDVAANFMIALKNFAENVRSYDKSLKTDSPIGVLTSRISSRFSLLDQAIHSVIDENIEENTINGSREIWWANFLNITEKNANNNSKNITVVLPPENLKKILDKLSTLIDETNVISSKPECKEFIERVKALRANDFKLEDLESVTNVQLNTETSEYFLAQLTNVFLYQKLYNSIAKKINEIGGKCFEIPYLTYTNNEKTKNLINKMRNEEVDPIETAIFFTLFNLIQYDGNKEQFVNNIEALRELDENKLQNLRINLKKDLETSRYLVTNWLPRLKEGSKIFYTDKDYLEVDDYQKTSPLYIIDFFTNIYSGVKDNIVDQMNIFEKNNINMKTLDNCLKDYKPVGPSTGKNRDTKALLLDFISGRMTEKPRSKSKYFGTVQFDSNAENESKVLRASYNGWKLNKSGKYEKFVNGKLVEYDPSTDVDKFYTSQCEALNTQDDLTCTQLMEQILIDETNTESIKSILNKANFAGSFASGKMRDIHPKLAKKILRNLGFKEIQFTTRLGTRVNLIEPYQNWLNRFVRSNKELEDLYKVLNSESGYELRLFLKLLAKAVNDEKTMSILSEKEKEEIKPDYSTVHEEETKMEEFSAKYGIKIYKSEPGKKPALSLEEIKKGFGPEPDIYGLKFDSNLNLLNAPADFALMSPFLYLVNAAFPGINISEPYRFTNTVGGQSGGLCPDYDGTEIDVNSGFDLKSKQLSIYWKKLKGSGVELDRDYVDNIDKLIDTLECGEATLLLNFARIKKLSELINADPSIVDEYSEGSKHIFTRDEIATIAKTFNEKMKDYINKLNKSFDLLNNLSNRAVIGEIDLIDIEA